MGAHRIFAYFDRLHAAITCARARVPRASDGSALRVLRSTVFLHDDPRAVNFVQLKPGHGGHLRGGRVRCLNVSEDFALRAQQHDAPAAFHPTGELGGRVLGGAAAGRHGSYIAPALPCLEASASQQVFRPHS